MQQLTDWLPKKLWKVALQIVVGIVVTASLTAMVLGLLGSNASASNLSVAMPESIVYRSPECSCCGGWSNHLKANGFKLKDLPTDDCTVTSPPCRICTAWDSL